MPSMTRPVDQRRYTTVAARPHPSQVPPPPFHAPSTVRPSASRAGATPRPALSAGATFTPPPAVAEVDPSNPMTYPRLANGQPAVQIGR